MIYLEQLVQIDNKSLLLHELFFGLNSLKHLKRVESILNFLVMALKIDLNFFLVFQHFVCFVSIFIEFLKLIVTHLDSLK